MQNLKRYIQQQEVLVIATGLVIGFALLEFVQNFIVAFITPILDRIMGGAGALEGKVTAIGGIEFKPGLFADSTLNFFAVLLVVFVMVRVFNTAVFESRKAESKSQNKQKDSKKK
jgi:large-conductance mechanosensitive channel